MNKLFVAKFAQTSGLPFKGDKHGTMPFIGTVLAGESAGSIINGTMFGRANLVEGQLYLCQNTVDPEYPDNVQTEVIQAVGALEFIGLRRELGNPINRALSTTASVEADEDRDLVPARATKAK